MLGLSTTIPLDRATTVVTVAGELDLANARLLVEGHASERARRVDKAA